MTRLLTSTRRVIKNDYQFVLPTSFVTANRSPTGLGRAARCDLTSIRLPIALMVQLKGCLSNPTVVTSAWYPRPSSMSGKEQAYATQGSRLSYGLSQLAGSNCPPRTDIATLIGVDHQLENVQCQCVDPLCHGESLGFRKLLRLGDEPLHEGVGLLVNRQILQQIGISFS